MLDTFKELVRDWFAKIWKVRGGGLYAVGWAVTFAYLQVVTIIDEFAEADGVVDFIVGQLLEFFLRFMVDTFMNMALAFAWPVYVLNWQQPFGIILLVLAFALFPIYVKPHITKWLFPNGDPDEWKGEIEEK